MDPPLRPGAGRGGGLHAVLGVRVGPAHAGAFGPNALDGTFGPQAVFVHAPPVANTSPAGGFQHFGEAVIDGETGAFRVDLRDADGASLF